MYFCQWIAFVSEANITEWKKTKVTCFLEDPWNYKSLWKLNTTQSRVENKI